MQFPPSIYSEIFSFLKVDEFMPLASLCKNASRASAHESLWKHLIPTKWKSARLEDFNNSWKLLYKLKALFTGAKRKAPLTCNTCQITHLAYSRELVVSESASREVIVWRKLVSPAYLALLAAPALSLFVYEMYSVAVVESNEVYGKCYSVWDLSKTLALISVIQMDKSIASFAIYNST